MRNFGNEISANSRFCFYTQTQARVALFYETFEEENIMAKVGAMGTETPGLVPQPGTSTTTTTTTQQPQPQQPQQPPAQPAPAPTPVPEKH